MNRSRKYQITLALISVCALGFIPIAKANDDETKLKFEIDNKKPMLWLSGRPKQPGQGPIKPTHVAVFHIRRPHKDMPNRQDGILQILKTSTGQFLSQQQQQFLTASDAITWWGIDEIKNHDTVLIYAVSEEDAKKMVQAYLEVPTNEVNERIQGYENYLKDKKQEVIKIKKVLPEKQKQADEIEPKYMEIKNTRYYSLSDDEAYEKAKETMLEMDKMLDILKIDLAGIEVKLTSIKQYRSTGRLPDRPLPNEVVDKLDQMLIEQIIELKSTEAREHAATKIHERDKAFVDLFVQWKNLSGEVNKLKILLEDYEKDVQRIEERLTNPTPDMLPPEIYQNKVTIYPVLPE